MGEKHSDLRDGKKISRLWYLLTCAVFRPVVFQLFRVQPVNRNIVPRRGAAILIANHVNFFDPIWIYDVLHRRLHFVATEELFRKRFVRFLVRQFGTIAFRRGGTDFQAIRNIVRILREGGLVGIYPEGVRSWDGTNSPIIPTIARIIRMVGVPVYYCRQERSYLHFPRWADHWRPLRVRLRFGRLYTPEMIPGSEEQVIADIAEAIRTPDYDIPVPRVRRRIRGLAAGIQRLLYRCPECRSIESLEAVKPPAANLVECRSCFALWEVDLGSRLTPVDETGRTAGEPKTVAALYRQVRAGPLEPIRSSWLPQEKGETLYLVSRPQVLYRERNFPDLRIFGFGRAFLTDRRFVFRGRRRNGKSVHVSIPLEEITAVTLEPGDKLHFLRKSTLYRIPIRGESPVKWFDRLNRLVENRKAAAPG